MVTERRYRRNNQRWTAAEFDRLVRSVKLEDVTPPVERFYSIASALERTPLSVRGMWLQLRDAGLRGKRPVSPAVAAYAADRFPAAVIAEEREDSLDGLVSAYRQAQRGADALLERIFALAGHDAEMLAGMRQSLTAMGPAPQVRADVVEIGESHQLSMEDRPAA
ncbi:MAG: hypothetical protein ACYDCQ_17630 [Dehalococcoidia bacterium]